MVGRPVGEAEDRNKLSLAEAWTGDEFGKSVKLLQLWEGFKKSHKFRTLSQQGGGGSTP